MSHIDEHVANFNVFVNVYRLVHVQWSLTITYIHIKTGSVLNIGARESRSGFARGL